MGKHKAAPSIRKRISLTIALVCVITSLLSIAALSIMYYGVYQYDYAAGRIASMAAIEPLLSYDIGVEASKLSSEQVAIDESKLWDYRQKISLPIAELEEKTLSAEGRKNLILLQRSESTFDLYVSKLYDAVRKAEKVSVRNGYLEEIHSMTALLKDYADNYIAAELNYFSQIREKLHVVVDVLLLVSAALISLLAAYVFYSIRKIHDNISKPIDRLILATNSVKQGNLSARIEEPGTDEISALYRNFNKMLEEVQRLLERIEADQNELRHTEMALLQAQINPHFLYNTLETIIWMNENKRSDQVVQLVQDLSSYFRSTLCNGESIVSLESEIRNISSYLSIQKVRYADILEYGIHVDPAYNGCLLPKLTLQPLVENALYHGIKESRQGGKILVQTFAGNSPWLDIYVIDEGVGMPETDVKRLNESLMHPTSLNKSNGHFGLMNVQKRLLSYFGSGAGLHLQSVAGKGTLVRVRMKALP